MFEFVTDQTFLNALAMVIGPLAFFAAPTEEIEHLLFASDLDVIDEDLALPAFIPSDLGVAKAA